MKAISLPAAILLLLSALLLFQSCVCLEAAIGKDVVPDEKEIFTKDRMVDDENPDDEHGKKQAQHEATQPQHPEDKQVEARTTTTELEECDDRTYLDLFGEKAKEFLTQKLIPPTDLECQWNWKHGRCEPLCLCFFQPKRGDFHLGRACRRVPADQADNCEELKNGPSFPAFPTPMMQAMVKRIKRRSATIQRQVSTKVDKLYGRIQEQVCQDVQQRCGLDGPQKIVVDGQQLPVGDNPQIFAWQEKLFCREYISGCDADG